MFLIQLFHLNIFVDIVVTFEISVFCKKKNTKLYVNMTSSTIYDWNIEHYFETWNSSTDRICLVCGTIFLSKI